MVLNGIELALVVMLLVLAEKDASTASHQDFLCDLEIEMELLRLTLDTLIQGLTSLSIDQRRRLLNFDHFDWKLCNSETVQEAIEARLEGSHAAFIETFNVILKSLNNLISDKSLGSNGSDLVCLHDDRKNPANITRGSTRPGVTQCITSLKAYITKWTRSEIGWEDFASPGTNRPVHMG